MAQSLGDGWLDGNVTAMDVLTAKQRRCKHSGDGNGWLGNGRLGDGWLGDGWLGVPCTAMIL